MNQLIILFLIILLGCLVYGIKIEPNWLEINSLNLTIPRLTSAFDGFKIVQISDLHVSHFMTEKRLHKAISLVKQQQPDLVVITGDFASKHHFFEPSLLIKKLQEITSEMPTLAVLGNHDHWDKKAEKVRKALLESNVIELNNQVYILNSGEEKLTVAGIDDPFVGFGNLNKVLKQLPETGAAILLVHEPDFIEITASTGKFDLQLSGHSHGGQIIIPFYGALVLPRGGRKYVSGLNQVGNTLEYTNRGIGTTGLPIRFGSRPEITVFTLTF